MTPPAARQRATGGCASRSLVVRHARRPRSPGTRRPGRGAAGHASSERRNGERRHREVQPPARCSHGLLVVQASPAMSPRRREHPYRTPPRARTTLDAHGSGASTSPAPRRGRRPTAARPVDATVSVPGSKSLTNRYLVLAALAEEPSRLRSPLHSRDTALMAAALGALGVRIEQVPGTSAFGPDWVVTPGPLRGPADVDCGLAGTVMRFVPPVAALATGAVRFDGDPAARRRPMATVVRAPCATSACRSTTARRAAGRLPFTVHGHGRRARRHAARSTPPRRASSSPGCCWPAPASRGARPRARRARRSRAPRTSS